MARSFPSANVATQRKCTTLSAVTIEIRTTPQDSSESWKIAILSLDLSADANFISFSVATDVLGLTLQPLHKESQSHVYHIRGQEIQVQGYVDIIWSVQGSRQIHTSRCLVTAAVDPPFDIVLGKEGIAQHKVGHKALRRWLCF